MTSNKNSHTTSTEKTRMLILVQLTGALLAGLALTSCTSFDIPEQLPGYWASEGYGRILAVTDNKLEAYDLAGSTCVKTPGSAKEFRSILGSSQLEFLNGAQQVDIAFANEPYKLRFKRLDTLPTPCIETTNTANNSTPQQNFEAFTNYFAEHYAFFELFGVDWQQRTNAARAQLTDQTSDKVLFDLFSHLLEPLQDAHINLFATIDGQNKSYGPEQSPLSAALKAQASAKKISVGELQQALLESLWEGNIKTTILAGKGTSAANGYIQYGVIPAANTAQVGYLAIQRETDYDKAGSDLAVLTKVMDAAIAQWQQANVVGVVIDIAINFGGSDYLSRAIANRFATKRTLAYRKRAADRVDAKDFDIYLEPYQGLQFTGPITLVTSTSTVSAGEILTMSLRSLPNVTHIGEPTRGSLSDILDKTLPNGWTITLSNEIYTDHQGKLWEGPGITPHKRISVLNPQDPIASHLKAIETAVAMTAAIR